MKICPICKSAVPDDAEYCDTCGNDEFYSDYDQQQFDQYEQPYQDDYNQQQYQQQSYQNDYNQQQYQQQQPYQNDYNQQQYQQQQPYQNDYNQQQYQQQQPYQNDYNQQQYQQQQPYQSDYVQQPQQQPQYQQPVEQAVDEQPIEQEQKQPIVEKTIAEEQIEVQAEENREPEVQEAQQEEEQPQEPEEPKENPYEVSKNFVFEKKEESEQSEEPEKKEMPKNVKGFLDMFQNTKNHTHEFDKNDISKNQKNAMIACLGITFWYPFIMKDYSRFARYYGNQGLLTLIAMIPSIIFYSIITGVIVCNACVDPVSHTLTFGGWIASLVFFVICFALPLFMIYCSVKNIKQGLAKDVPFIGGLRLIS